MRKRKVVIWGKEDVLSHAVELFLGTRNDWEVSRFPNNCSINTFLDAVCQIQPDVVVIYDEDCNTTQKLLTRVLKVQSELKVVILTLENNSIEIYDRHSVRVSEVSDLLDAIQF